jgi:PKD repeat protein
MPTARVGAAGVIVNGMLYVFGGYTAINGVYWSNETSAVEAYDPGSNTWITRAPMPADAYMDGAGVIDGKVYIVGGVNYPHGLRIYDPASNSWSVGPDRPVNSENGAVDVIGGKLYVRSGWFGESKNDFYSFDPSAGAWTQLPGSPNFHTLPVHGVINNKLYIAGGEDGNFGRYMNIYDPATNAWTVGTPMPAQLWDHPASGVVNGKLYAIAGGILPPITPNGVSPEMTAYDPATDSWQAIAPSVNAGGPYAGAAGASIAFSGQSSDVLPPIPTARDLAVGGVINGTIYVAGGGDVTDTKPLATLEAISPPAIAPLTFAWDFGDGSAGQGAQAAHAYTAAGTYQVTLTVTTPAGRTGSARTTVVVSSSPPVANAGGPYSSTEGSALAFDATRSTDPSGAGLAYAWDFGDGTAGTGPTPTHVYVDNGTFTVRLTVTNGQNLTSTATTTASVTNLPPSVGSITAPVSPVQIGNTITASAQYTDQGILDTHVATIDWGDGTSSSATVTESNGSGTANGSHSYAAPGVYQLSLTVTDKDGGASTSVFQYVVAYDPSGGFVTGGGWITSPAGAYAANTALTGKATFGFVAKYQHGANVPSGNTQFQFNAAGFNFSSTSYDWLVVAGSKAQYKGSGTINGSGDYAFMLTAVDGHDNGGTDKFRLKVWDKTTGAVIYDNEAGTSDTGTPTTALAGGSIIIHN